MASLILFKSLTQGQGLPSVEPSGPLVPDTTVDPSIPASTSTSSESTAPETSSPAVSTPGVPTTNTVPTTNVV